MPPCLRDFGAGLAMRCEAAVRLGNHAWALIDKFHACAKVEDVAQLRKVRRGSESPDFTAVAALIRLIALGFQDKTA